MVELLGKKPAGDADRLKIERKTYDLMARKQEAAIGLQAFVKDRLAPFKYPRSIVFLDELPKTATGKIQKYILRGGRDAIGGVHQHGGAGLAGGGGDGAGAHAGG
jgi:acyl-CoA synthetase (AMP-forming)/AMP-acid ligase II